MNLSDFIKDKGIFVTWKYAVANPEDPVSGNNPNNCTYFKCKLKSSDRRLGFFMTKNGPDAPGPTPKDALVYLQRMINASVKYKPTQFEVWAKDFNKSTDSRKAEKLFRNYIKKGNQLKKFLGDESFSNFLRCSF